MIRPRVLLADDHPALLKATTALLKPQFDVVGTATDGTTVGSGPSAVTVLEQEVQCSPREERSSMKLSSYFTLPVLVFGFGLKYKCTAELDTGNRFVGRYLRFYR